MNVTIVPDVEIGHGVGIMHQVAIGPSHEVDGVPKIGEGVFIVGAGAMISANSLVISDDPPGAFAVGVPAKAIRWRSNDTVAEAGAHAQGSVGSKDS